MGYIVSMFELRTTLDFDKWLSKLKDPVAKHQVALRPTRLQAGNAGDTKQLDERLYELRIFRARLPHLLHLAGHTHHPAAKWWR